MDLEAKDYRDYLKTAIEDKKSKIGKPYTYQQMSAHCKVQTSYLSNALRKRSHLNSDQIFLGCEFLGFSDSEVDYVQTLSEFNKTACQSRKKKLEARLSDIRSKYSLTKNHLQKTPDAVNEEWFHFDVNAQLIQLCTSTVTKQRSPEQISKTLDIPADEVRRILDKLISSDLLTVESDAHGNYFKPRFPRQHIEKGSYIHQNFHRNRQLKAIELLSRRPDSGHMNFSVLATSDHRFRDLLHEKLLSVVKWAENYTLESSSESTFESKDSQEVIMLNMDLIKAAVIK